GAGSAQSQRLSLASKAGDLLARRPEALPPDRMAEIGFFKRLAAQGASGDGNHPRVARDDSAAQRSLIANRGHQDDPSPGGMIKRLRERKLRPSRRLHQGEA